jgi:ribosome biogenesis GTPase / thiamine phosphate phosphatase
VSVSAFGSLSDWGWNEYWAAQRESVAAHGEVGRVLWSSRGISRVAHGEGEFNVRALQGVEPATAGDWLLYDPQHAIVTARLPRRTSVSRKKAGKQWSEQVLAANVDLLFLVAGLDGDFNLRRLERYLVMARQSGAAAVIVLNKCDACDDPLAALQSVERVTGGSEPVVLMSALDRGSVMQLHRYMEPGQTAVVLGSSGAGKSTILNALRDERQLQRTQPVREHDSRGRHTTVQRHLFRLPQGWMLIDTPGLRELEPWAGTEALEQAFPDIGEYAAHCRYRDCAHDGEPGCAVAEAIAEGRLDAERLGSLRKLRAELRHLETLQGVRAAQAERRRWRAIHRAAREIYKHGKHGGHG